MDKKEVTLKKLKTGPMLNKISKYKTKTKHVDRMQRIRLTILFKDYRPHGARNRGRTMSQVNEEDDIVPAPEMLNDDCNVL
jgi:hypothetical protein